MMVNEGCEEQQLTIMAGLFVHSDLLSSFNTNLLGTQFPSPITCSCSWHNPYLIVLEVLCVQPKNGEDESNGIEGSCVKSCHPKD